MAVTANRECWKEILEGFKKFGFTSKELEFDIQQKESVFTVILTKEFFDFLKRMSRKKECDLGKLLDLKYETASWTSFHYKIEASGYTELYLIQYAMAVARRELQEGREKYISKRQRIKRRRLEEEKKRLFGLADTTLLKLFGKEYRFKMKLVVYKDKYTKEYVISVGFSGLKALKKKLRLKNGIEVRGINPHEMIEDLERKLSGEKNRKN